MVDDIKDHFPQVLKGDIIVPAGGHEVPVLPSAFSIKVQTIWSIHQSTQQFTSNSKSLSKVVGNNNNGKQIDYLLRNPFKIAADDLDRFYMDILTYICNGTFLNDYWEGQYKIGLLPNSPLCTLRYSLGCTAMYNYTDTWSFFPVELDDELKDWPKDLQEHFCTIMLPYASLN